jgi:hypothetical protein
MATGDVTISVAVAGGVTKSVVLDSATRVLSRAHVAGSESEMDDAEWQVFEVNKLASVILAQANSQAQAAASWTSQTFTAAS